MEAVLPIEVEIPSLRIMREQSLKKLSGHVPEMITWTYWREKVYSPMSRSVLQACGSSI